MFTGIIESTGQVIKKTDHQITIKAPKLVKVLKKGSSISVDGVCLTVSKKEKDAFEADVMPVTYEKTILGYRKPSDIVNLELAMSGNKRFEGHVMSGHVEGRATLLEIKIVENAYELNFKIAYELTRYIVPEGSIAINGISLTVMSADEKSFKVGIIPHTWDNTNLHLLKIGDDANIETDLLAKYAAKLVMRSV